MNAFVYIKILNYDFVFWTDVWLCKYLLHKAVPIAASRQKKE